MNELNKLRLCLALSSAALVLAIGTCLWMLVYTIRHDHELSERDIVHAREIGVLSGSLTNTKECNDKSLAELAKIKNWMIAIYSEHRANVPQPPP